MDQHGLKGAYASWLIVLGFDSLGYIMLVGDAHVFPGILTPVLTQLSFKSHRVLFSQALAEVRGENTPERKFTSTPMQVMLYPRSV